MRRWAGVIVFALLAVATLAVQPWSGPVLLVFSSYHGIDLSDLVPAGFALVSAVLLVDAMSVHPGPVRVVRRFRTAARPWRRFAQVSAGLALGAASLIRLEDSVQPRLFETAVTVSVLAVVAAWVAMSVDRDLLVAGVVLAVGFLADAVAVPSGTLFGPLLLALFLAQRDLLSGNRWSTAALVAVTLAFAALSTGSLFDVAELDTRMAGSDGGPARTGALGLVLVIHGLLGTMTGDRTAHRTGEPGTTPGAR